MIKIKKSILCLYFFLFFASVTGCNYEPNRFGKPDDGLFLYSGNIRTLTDGSNEEQLVSSIEYEGQVYTGLKMTYGRYVYREDNIFFYFNFDENKIALVEYNIKDKSQRVIYFAADLPVYLRGLTVFDDLIIFEYYQEVFAIDYQGNIIEKFSTIADNPKYSFIEKHIICNEENDVFYKTWGDDYWTKVFTINNNDAGLLGVNLISGGFIIETYEKVLNSSYPRRRDYYEDKKIYVYDIKADKIIIPGGTMGKCGQYIGNGYYLVYKNEIKPYKAYWIDIETGERIPETRYDAFKVNFELYKLDDKFNAAKLYTFDPDMDFTHVSGYNDEYIYFYIDQIYSLDLNSFKLSKGFQTPKDPGDMARGTAYGDYIIYNTFRDEFKGWKCTYIFMLEKDYDSHYYLRRYNVKTKKDEVMQCNVPRKLDTI